MNKHPLEIAKQLLEQMPNDEFLEICNSVENNNGPTVEDFNDVELSDYQKYRGKCKILAEAACANDPELRLVRGFYHCPIWGKEQHWWCEYPDGRVVDPSVRQYPTKGVGATYEEFDGWCECDECGKRIREEEARFDSRYVFCSSKCNMRFVGL